MIELARHIEILLLDNDCVIIPGFGGFVTHHVSARRVEEENLFLPPYRTLGFNPAMKLNDGLLVQSYMTAYDASYPEAIRIVNSKVHKLEDILHKEGEYELHGIGVLRENIQGQYTFKPLEAGILSPNLYGLSSFEFKTIQQLTKEQAEEKAAIEAAKLVAQKKAEAALEPAFIRETEKKIVEMKPRSRKRERYINIAAAAIAVIFISLLALPFATNLGKATSEMKKTMSQTMTEDSRSMVTKVIDAMGMKTTNNVATPTVKAPETEEIKTDSKAKEETVVTPKETGKYTLVLACQVGKKNAQTFINRLYEREGIQAEIQEDKFISIIYSQFNTQDEAYRKLNELKHIPEFKKAWVKEIK